MANTAHEIDYTDSELDEALGRAMTVPAVGTSDNGKIMEVVNGAWAAVKPIAVYSGSSAPSSSLGKNGDIYIQTN